MLNLDTKKSLFFPPQSFDSKVLKFRTFRTHNLPFKSTVILKKKKQKNKRFLTIQLISQI